MRGSVQLKRGIWQAVIYYTDEQGVNKQKWISTGLAERGNKKAAQAILKQEIRKFEDHLSQEKMSAVIVEARSSNKEIAVTGSEKGEVMFSDWVWGYILLKKDKLSPEVYHNYSKNIYKQIKYFFDKKKLRLNEVTTQDIEDFYSELKKGGIKNVTVKRYSEVVRPALTKAKKEKIIAENPHDYVEPIRREKYIAQYYSAEEMEVFFNAIKGHRLELVFKMAAYYGLRRSELIGLRWQSIDFVNKTISVNNKVIMVKRVLHISQELKTASSHRTLPLIPVIEKELLLHQEYIKENKLRYRSGYNDKFRDYIFVNDVGDLILPDDVTHQFAKVLKQNNLKHIRFHDLRHSCASIMLANGIQMKQIQEWLGHSNFATTADIYSHLDFSSKLESAKAIEFALSPKFEAKEGLSSLGKLMSLLQELTEEELAEHIKKLKSNRSKRKNFELEM